MRFKRYCGRDDQWIQTYVLICYSPKSQFHRRKSVMSYKNNYRMSELSLENIINGHLRSPAHRPDPPCPYVRWPEGRLHWWFVVGLTVSSHYSPGALQQFPDLQRSSSCVAGDAEEARPVQAPAAAQEAPEREPAVLCVGRSVWRAKTGAEEGAEETAGTLAQRGESEGYGPLNCLRPPSPGI